MVKGDQRLLDIRLWITANKWFVPNVKCAKIGDNIYTNISIKFGFNVIIIIMQDKIRKL